jgi:hypothetical protein
MPLSEVMDSTHFWRSLQRSRQIQLQLRALVYAATSQRIAKSLLHGVFVHSMPFQAIEVVNRPGFLREAYL